MLEFKNAIADHALQNARFALGLTCQMSDCFISGTLKGYEPLSRQAYLLGYELQTLGETMNWALLSSPGNVQSILDKAAAVLERAKQFEQSHLSRSLSPSDVYFDDLVDMNDLAPTLILVERAPAEVNAESLNP